MAHNEETRRGVAPRRASELHSAGKLEFSEVRPSQAPTQELPRVVEARARDALARAKLRGQIPRTMANLENGRVWRKTEAQRAAAVFPPKSGGDES